VTIAYEVTYGLHHLTKQPCAIRSDSTLSVIYRVSELQFGAVQRCLLNGTERAVL